MIDQVTIDRILDAAQIVDVVSEFVTLRKRGVNYVGLCPFHNEKTPSFSVSPAKGLCKCFSCGNGGNSVHFIMEHEQMSYYEALKLSLIHIYSALKILTQAGYLEYTDEQDNSSRIDVYKRQVYQYQHSLAIGTFFYLIHPVYSLFVSSVAAYAPYSIGTVSYTHLHI